jgi:hypothetical protein
MFSNMLDSLFGCTHRRTTFPLTPGRRSGYSAETVETRGKTYVACLDCGKEFDYDWRTMRIGSPLRPPVATGQPVHLQ